MARKSNRPSEGTSSGDGSAQSDVEMPDRQDDRMNGFKKFGVSAIHASLCLAPALFIHRGKISQTSGLGRDHKTWAQR